MIAFAEEVPVGTLIGSIPTKAGFTYRYHHFNTLILHCFNPEMYSLQRHTRSQFNSLTFNSGRLNQPSSHFTLSPTSGELRTSSRLDREGRDGSDSVDLVALSSSPTYPIEASHLLISNFFHMSLNKWRAGSPIMWVRGGVTDMSEHMGQHQPGRAIR